MESIKANVLIAGMLIVGCLDPHAPDISVFAAFETPEPALQGNLDMDTQSRIIQRGLKRESLKLNLEPLSESDSEDEIRLWVGFGLLTPRCFTSKRVGRVQKAMYYATKSKPAPEGAATKYGVEQIATVLGSPKSGWQNFEVFLRSRGIDSPIKLTSDLDLTDTDGEDIIIEVRSRGVYSMVFFPTETKSLDGLKARDVCQKIENEFNIKMGCSVPVRTKE